jgi:hypothetical protein
LEWYFSLKCLVSSPIGWEPLQLPSSVPSSLKSWDPAPPLWDLQNQWEQWDRVGKETRETSLALLSRPVRGSYHSLVQFPSKLHPSCCSFPFQLLLKVVGKRSTSLEEDSCAGVRTQVSLSLSFLFFFSCYLDLNSGPLTC